MLDSLVRVSRRVGWRADRFATDPKCPVHPSRSPSALSEHCKQSTQFDRTARAEGRQARQFLGPSTSQRGASITPSPKTRLPSAPASDRRRTGRGALPEESAHTGSGRTTSRSLRIQIPQSAARRQVEFLGPTLRIHPFASKRFHVLLNSLFKVLFNFPSRYLSAIGLVPVFSLRWSLPPTLGCIPKQPDSKDVHSRCL